MKVTVQLKKDVGVRLPTLYNGVTRIEKGRADSFMDPDELKSYGVKKNSSWTRLYMADGGTATYSTNECIIKVMEG